MDAHRVARGTGELNEVAVIGVDYGYLNDSTSGVLDASGLEQKVEAFPFLGVNDNRHKWVAGHVVPAKGRDLFAIEALAAEVLNSGHAEVELMSDQEPAILALRESVAAKVRAKGGRVRLTEAPLHDSRGNGLAESGIKEIKDQTRTLLAATCSAYGKTINPDSVLIP